MFDIWSGRPDLIFGVKLLKRFLTQRALLKVWGWGGGGDRGPFTEVAPESRCSQRKKMKVCKRSRKGDHEFKHQSNKVRCRKLSPSFSYLLSLPLLLGYLRGLQNSRKKSIKSITTEMGKRVGERKKLSPGSGFSFVYGSGFSLSH